MDLVKKRRENESMVRVKGEDLMKLELGLEELKREL